MILEAFKTNTQEFADMIKRIGKNKPLIFLIVGDIVQFIQISAFILFTPKFMAHAFK